ncbi:MAG: hypothetical protein ACPGJV_15295 [Bacteriovoracaceae bacterium]
MKTLVSALFIITIILITSCSSTVIRTKNKKIPISFTKKENHVKKVFIEVEKSFYLWGIVPAEHVLYVDSEVGDHGIDSLASVKITEKKDDWKTFLSMISLGTYIPKTYIIEGKTYLK